MTKQVAERRKNHRIETELPRPSLELVNSGNPAVLKNISVSGLSCICSEQIPEMTLVDLKMQLPALPEEDLEFYPLSCKGAVVRCEPISRSNSRRKWMIAIYFTEVDDENKDILHRYVKGRS
ncbi:MAG: PilZ domain-containing protein [Planctomycetes bacterium]|nr:PilZ domain-containing protein [Planctomycetota bacterium]